MNRIRMHRLAKARPVNIATGRARIPEKRFPTTGDLLILEILKILDILLQTDGDGQAQCLSTHTGKSALTKRAYRGVETGRSLLPGI